MNHPLRRPARLLLVGALALLATLAGLAPPAGAAPRQEADPEAYTNLTLLNDWVPYGFGTGIPRVKLSNGIVRFKGAMADGSSPNAFVLPVGMRPALDAYVPVDLCDTTNGRLHIRPNGEVGVEAEVSFDDATCFTSLEGASFAVAPPGQVSLPLINGWSTPKGSRAARAALVGGVVHLSGAIETLGTDKHPFVIPAGMRPGATIFVPLDLCGAADGRLRIGTSGVVTVQADDDFADAQCFTSLDGATWVVNPTTQTTLSLENGWVDRPYHTRRARAGLIAGVVRFSGAVANGTDNLLFTLPVGLRPTKIAFVQVDLCGATNGRLVIDPNGSVLVEADGGDLNRAICFTSLEGASFAR